MKNNVSVNNLVKQYSGTEVVALDQLSFEVDHGELFGVIGPDGGGKTTLFRILTTLILPDSGSASVADLDVVKDFWEIRKIVGYMPGKFSLYQDLSIDENLHFFATVFNTTVKENYDLIRDIYVQLEPFKNRRAGKLSGGMKQKLALCCALIHEPRILILDEPTTGVDPVSRKEFWNMLDQLKAKGITILVSTPYMDEASRCDRIALLQKGKLLEVSTFADILTKHRRPTLAVQATKMFQLLSDLKTYPGCYNCYSFGSHHHLVLKADYQQERQQLHKFLEQRGHTDINYHPVETGIEDVFIDLMGEMS